MVDHTFFLHFRSLLPSTYVNQFPGEGVLTNKDLMAAVSKQASSSPKGPQWLPETYNLFYDLPHFVHTFKQREQE